MSRRCSCIRGGIWCGRTAKQRLGLAVPPHSPAITHDLCRDHAKDFADVLTDEARQYLVIEEIE